MKKASQQFKLGIRSMAREIDTRVIFFNDDNRYVIKGADVQSFKYSAACEYSLGSIENKIADIVLIKNTITEKIIEGTVLYREVWVKYNGTWYSDYQERLIVQSKKVDDETSLIKIVAVDELTLRGDEDIPNILQSYNVTNIAYLKSVLAALTNSYKLADDLVSNTLKIAYTTGTNIRELLNELAISVQGVIRDDFTVSKFSHGQFVDRLDYETGLIKYSIEDSDIKDVSVNIFCPTQSATEKLSEFTSEVPSNNYSYNLGTLNLSEPCLIQMVKFDTKLELDRFTLNSNTLKLSVINKGSAKSVQAEVHGLKLSSANMSMTENNNAYYVDCTYIQDNNLSKYDTSIYTGKRITINYKGNSLYEIGDTIILDGKYHVLIVEHDLNYTGSLNGTIKGVIV